MNHPAHFHEDTGTVRFRVTLGERDIGGSIRREVLHHRFRPEAQGEDPLSTYHAHELEIAEAVRRRVAGGSIEPVMLREFDLRP